MSEPDRHINIKYLNVSESFEGHSRSEYIFVTDFDLYRRTQGRELELKGDSPEFIETAGCGNCHLKDVACIPIDRFPRRGRIAHYFVDDSDDRTTPCSEK